MKTSLKALAFVCSIIIGNACTNDGDPSINNPPGNNSPGNNSTVWLIPINEVRDGGPGKDGIPALTNPQMISSGQASYLTDNDLILGFAEGGTAKAYPHKILDWHEIINDKIGNTSVSVIYCPLTGTGIGWDRIINGKETTFGVSGLLFNTNVIPYDRGSDTNWSQLALLAVNGSLAGEKPGVINLIETTWGTWKEMYPNTTVVSTNTGHNRNYQQFPYGDYKTNQNAIFFPVSKRDNRLPAKERVLTIIGTSGAKVYSIENFSNVNRLIADTFEGLDVVVVGNKTKNFIVSYKSKLPDGTVLNFSPLEEGAIIMTDQEGNRWDVLGNAVSGPRRGQSLESFPRMIGYWFSWAPFYDNLSVF
jgi:hypothetical protein